MAVRHHLIRRPPHAVWAVLADPVRYGEWVVGPSESTPLDQAWPEVGSRIRYTVRLGPWSADGVTTVRHGETGGALHNAATEALLQLRHRGMLARLARVVEQQHEETRHT
ncbi:SRPBCC family protein [Streptomyces mirabilis]